MHSLKSINSRLLQVSMMERDFYLGRILTGRISSGIIHVGDKIHGLRISDNGVEKIEDGRVCCHCVSGCYCTGFTIMLF